jgi:conjugative relaxase-like TrwC/TraI family protein
MSKALSAAGAVTYFKDEYEHARGSYYTEDEKVIGHWSGELAQTFRLSGAVGREHFERLAEGLDPHNGEQFIRHVKRHKRTNGDGKEIETGGHRAGCDITFSAPKSVSLAALVGGDERIKEAHAVAVTTALREVEKYAQARLGGNAKAETTGKLLFASFQHDAARPDRRDGYAAPDLHTHNFAFNLTQTAEGKIKPVQPLELYRCQKYGTAIYRAKLAERLEKLGYEIEVDKRTGAPEIKGISREYIEAASPRQRDIKETAAALQMTSTRAVAGRNRRTKTYNRDEMKERHQELDRQHGGQAHKVVSESRAMAQMMSGFLLWDEQTSQMKARESVTFAIEKGSERESVTDIRSLMMDALRRNLGHTTVEEISAEMHARQERGQLIGLVLDDEARQRMTTEKTLQMETANIEKVRSGQGTQQPIAERVAETLTTSRGITLSESQCAAFEQIVASRDQITGLQGGAGTGKTTALAAVREAAERAGYEVQGFAPTTRAAQLLAESGMETRTLQKFIRQKDDPEAQPRFYVLDESSLASTKQVHAFLSRVRPEDRVLLVGDIKQHEAIEAGSPFSQLVRHGMATAKLEQIVRQKDAPLCDVVEHLSVGEIKEAVEGLREQGRITEIADPHERLRAIAKDYCTEPESALVISPANKERVELNRLIHQQLQKVGQVFSKNYKTKVLENRTEMTGAERTFAAAYEQDDIIRYTSSSKKYGISAGEYACVLSTDDKENTITVKLDKSQREVTYDPKRLQGVSVYREAARQFSERDRIQFRAPYHPQRIANGELGTLEKIEKGRLTVTLDSGRSVSFPIEKNRHIDHGYAVTSYSSQGQTVDRVLVNADTSEPDKLLNQRVAYVATSRARQDARIYTDSDQGLSTALARQVDKSTALEAARRAVETRRRASIVLVEPTPQQTTESQPATRQDPRPNSPTRIEQQEGPERATQPERPPAPRAPQPVRTEPAKPPARLPLEEGLQRLMQELAEQQAAWKPLPIPDKPPERPYIMTTPVDPRRPAAELSAEIVQLANASRLERTGQGISAPVQRLMDRMLLKGADQPPTPQQLQGIADSSKALGLRETPQMSTALQASFWTAHNAPDRTEKLEQATQFAETAFAQQQSLARESEPSISNQPSLNYDTGPSIDIDF